MCGVTSGQRQIHGEVNAVVLRQVEGRSDHPVVVGGVTRRYVVRALQAIADDGTSEAAIIGTADNHATRYIDDIIGMRLTERPLGGADGRCKRLVEIRAARGLEGSFLREAALTPALTTERLNTPYIGGLRRQALHGAGIRRYLVVEDHLVLFGEERIGRNLNEEATGGIHSIPREHSVRRT